MESSEKIVMYPDNNNNGLFGNNNGWGGGLIGFILGILFGNGGLWGNHNGSMMNAGGFLSNQMDLNSMRETIMNAINGADADIRLLATTLNTDVSSIKSALSTVNTSITALAGQVGMSNLQVINAIQSGNTTLANQLSQCCCENKLLTTQQGYEAQIRTLQQTNQLGSQADRNNASVLNAIAEQTALITKEFCEAKERDMQDKINALNTENATLKTTLNNNAQTAQISNMINELQNQLNAIKSAQPQTITLPLNNYQAVPAFASTLSADLLASYIESRIKNSSSSSSSSTTTT